ncbi:hypothetical protein Ciccas_011478, partial [Cichlidogyrus casuarinus]
FELVVQGGGLVQLDFLRYPTCRFDAALNVYVPVNEIVILADVYLLDRDSQLSQFLAQDMWAHSLKGDLLLAEAASNSDVAIELQIKAMQRSIHFASARNHPKLCGDHEIGGPYPRLQMREGETMTCMEGDSELCLTLDAVMMYSLQLGETGIGLMYRSDRAGNFNSSMLIELSGENVPKQLEQVHLIVQISGRSFSALFNATANLRVLFRWDRLDCFGQPVYGESRALISVGYQYRPSMQCPDRDIFWDRRYVWMQARDQSPSDLIDWRLSKQHFYAPNLGIVYRYVSLPTAP